jgi:hypothetical protein
LFLPAECDGTGEPNIEPQVIKLEFRLQKCNTLLLKPCLFFSNMHLMTNFLKCSSWSGLAKIQSVHTVKALATLYVMPVKGIKQ